MSRAQSRDAGFTLIELLTALAIFLAICGVAFGLLTTAMKKFQSESQALDTFQEARFGLDQIVRDINDAGYPPVAQFQVPPADQSLFANAPIAWRKSQGYPDTPCAIGVNCVTPGDFDLILETKVDPLDPATGVQWIRYQLQGTTLFRVAVPKPSNQPVKDPDVTTTNAGLVPYVQNVMNGAVPIFTYYCGSALAPCVGGGGGNSTTDVRSISVTLIVRAPNRDLDTGNVRLIELQGRGRVINPAP